MYSTYILNFSLVRRHSEAEVGESFVLENNNHCHERFNLIFNPFTDRYLNLLLGLERIYLFISVHV